MGDTSDLFIISHVVSQQHNELLSYDQFNVKTSVIWILNELNDRFSKLFPTFSDLQFNAAYIGNRECLL